MKIRCHRLTLIGSETSVSTKKSMTAIEMRCAMPAPIRMAFSEEILGLGLEWVIAPTEYFEESW